MQGESHDRTAPPVIARSATTRQSPPRGSTTVGDCSAMLAVTGRTGRIHDFSRMPWVPRRQSPRSAGRATARAVSAREDAPVDAGGTLVMAHDRPDPVAPGI